MSTAKVTKRSDRQWYEEAARCYVEKHQGCPWCGGSHRVYRLVRDSLQTYSCQGCDFQANYDQETGVYTHIDGEPQTEKSPTMFDL